MNPEELILLGSTICVMLTVHFSMKLLSEHVLNWENPKEQKAVVVITLMAPIYVIGSYVGLIKFLRQQSFLHIVRLC
ncbi:hypothetical protein L6164_022544 [Bauhinia variegata]|uniref:Uncharacterized protein n=1 Tax=Bauhinia variegata TaxID=167791 RepID=A0ACB9MGU7_BAUVA|nr:hypothetical protein L6164_022544 [Bauhinia variegata]